MNLRNIILTDTKYVFIYIKISEVQNCGHRKQIPSHLQEALGVGVGCRRAEGEVDLF